MMKCASRVWLKIAFFFCFTGLTSYGSYEQLSFDRLYPQSWYSNVLENCMKIWSEIEVVEAFDANEQERIFDACLGRIVYCEHLYEAYQTRLYKRENIPYLIKGLDRIAKRCERILQIACEDKMNLFKNYLNKFKNKLLDTLGS